MNTGAATIEEVRVGIYECQLLSTENAAQVAAQAMQQQGWSWGTIARGHVHDIIDPTARTAEVLYEATAATIIRPLRDAIYRDTQSVATALAGVKTSMSAGQLIRYYAGGFYHAHRDSGEPNANRRAVAALCYLNENFEGGGLHFPELQYTFKPRAGVVMLFPATYLHCAEVVTRGLKLVLASWYLDAER